MKIRKISDAIDDNYIVPLSRVTSHILIDSIYDKGAFSNVNNPIKHRRYIEGIYSHIECENILGIYVAKK